MKRRRRRLVLRVVLPSSPLAPFVVGSLVFHLGFSAALAFLPSLRRGPAPFDDAFVVGLVAAPAPSGPGGGSGVTAAPAPASPPAGVHLAPPKPAEPKAEKKPQKKKEAPKEKPASSAARLPPDTGPISPSAGAPGPSAAGAGPGAPGTPGATGSGILSVGAGDPRFSWYVASVVALLQNHWMRPVLDGVGGSLTVTVTFDVERDGTVHNLDIERSSGVPSLDRSALRAVEDASPLPPPPQGLGPSPFPARFEFRWSPGTR